MEERKGFEHSLWIFLTWLGFRFVSSSTSRKWLSNLRTVLGSFFTVSSVYMSIHVPSLLTFNFWTKRKSLELLSHYIQSVLFILLFVNIKRQSNAIRNVIKCLNKYPSEQGISCSLMYLVVLGIYLFFIPIHDVLSVPQYMSLFLEPYIPYEVVRGCILNYTIFMYHVCQFFVPTIIGVVFCVICKQIVVILVHFEDLLKGMAQCQNACVTSEMYVFVKRYSAFTAIVANYNETFSFPIFFVMVMYFVKMFAVMASVLLTKSFTIYSWLWIEIVNTLITAVTITYAVCNIASQMTKRMENIKSLFTNIYGDLLISRTDDRKGLALIKHASTRNAIVLTGANIFFFSMNFLVYSLGALFTYGLLFIQIQVNWD